ncbi:hypothetical protein HYV64_05225 [Candidatus Shapirobacteria bacterium]|nr:hypothetical protein [Candidatus Shapirobacteria bacterium]
MVKLNTIVELTDIPGFSGLSPDEQRAVKLTVDAAKGARLNAANQIKTDPVRVREGARTGQVLDVLHNIEDIIIRTKIDHETGRKLITAIPDITLRAAIASSQNQKGTSSTNGTKYQDLFDEIFGKQGDKK